MALNWVASDYFSMLIHGDKRAHAGLEMLVDDLHCDKERTINKFLCHSGSEDFLWGLVKLLGNTNSRVAGNAAYILGTLAESEFGSMRVISLTSARQADSKRILADLTNMLTFDDTESVMNAAGTMGTLAETHEGRQWILKESCLGTTIKHITALLESDNMWTASNAALVLARLTIAEEGCEEILRHVQSDMILSCLIDSLGIDEAGRGMNAAFAIGRLCDLEVGRMRLLGLQESEKMILSLAKMLCCSDPGASKNACFALSCLATNKEGLYRLLKSSQSEEVLKTLAELLSADDSETGWFAAMTLRTLASQPKGCLRLRENSAVIPALKAMATRDKMNPDLNEEITQTIEILRRLDKPDPPSVEVDGSQANLSWPEMTTKSGFIIRYHIFEGARCMWSGRDTKVTLNGLKPFTQYSYRLRGSTEGDDSPLSETVTIVTEEAAPGPPLNVCLLGATTSQLKVGWEPPEETNGTLKGYYVYNGSQLVEHTAELSSIISGLASSTTYEIHVCAATCKGKGSKETITATTSEMGAHAPSKPEVNVRGRSEMHVSWRPPEVPLGRIFRYDVLLNGDVAYSGTTLHFVARRLKADTEYSVVVVAVTSDGKCESKATKKRTAKDEFEGERAPLYQTPAKPDQDKKETPKVSNKKRKSVPSLHSGFSQDAPTKLSMTRVNSATLMKKEKADDIQSSRKSSTDEPPDSYKKEVAENIPLPLAQCEAWDFSLHSLNQLQKQHTTASTKNRKAKPHDSSHTSQDGTTNLPKPDKTKALSRPRSGARRTQSLKAHSRSHEPHSTNVSLSADRAKRLGRRSSIENTRTLNADSRTDSDNKTKTRTKPKGVISPDSGLRAQGRRGSGNWKVNPLSMSLPESLGFSDTADGELLDARNGKPDPDNPWMNNNKRSEFPVTQETVTRMYSSNQLPLSQFKPGMTQALKPGLVEFDNNAAGFSKMPLGPPNYIQRAATFVSSHRPAAKKQLEKIQTRSPTFIQESPPHQWQPELPSSHTQRNHNKFVPMQFRTQPSNLPGTLSRQTTQVPSTDRGPLEVLARSHTEFTVRKTATPPIGSHHNTQSPSSGHRQLKERAATHPKSSPVSSLSPSSEEHSNHLNHHGSSITPDQTKSVHGPVHTAHVLNTHSGAATQESLVIGLGVSTDNNNTLQSTR